MFNAPLWHDYFVMVGGGAAALTGLVFVAMSLHLSDIVHNPAHRHRARTILTALTDVFVRCGLVLMGGQSGRAVGAELFVVLLGVEFVVLRSLAPGAPQQQRRTTWRALQSLDGALRGNGGGTARRSLPDARLRGLPGHRAGRRRDPVLRTLVGPVRGRGGNDGVVPLHRVRGVASARRRRVSGRADGRVTDSSA